MTAASAYTPQSPEPAMGRPAEPSMEDILASIRRIIADDQSQGSKPAINGEAPRAQGAEAERTPARTRTPYDDVLDLARLVPAADRQVQRPVEANASVETGRSAHQGHPEPDYDTESYAHENLSQVTGLRARLPEPTSHAMAEDDQEEMFDHSVPATTDDQDSNLLSAPMGASVMSAFETLAATVVLQNTPMLEGVMRDLMRPLLKTWLDDNLPVLVERLVRGEIERVARGGRG